MVGAKRVIMDEDMRRRLLHKSNYNFRSVMLSGKKISGFGPQQAQLVGASSPVSASTRVSFQEHQNHGSVRPVARMRSQQGHNISHQEGHLKANNSNQISGVPREEEVFRFLRDQSPPFAFLFYDPF